MHDHGANPANESLCVGPRTGLQGVRPRASEQPRAAIPERRPARPRNAPRLSPPLIISTNWLTRARSSSDTWGNGRSTPAGRCTGRRAILPAQQFPTWAEFLTLLSWKKPGRATLELATQSIGVAPLHSATLPSRPNLHTHPAYEGARASARGRGHREASSIERRQHLTGDYMAIIGSPERFPIRLDHRHGADFGPGRGARKARCRSIVTDEQRCSGSKAPRRACGRPQGDDGGSTWPENALAHPHACGRRRWHSRSLRRQGRPDASARA